MLKATVRIIEIAELVGVSHQQANKIADAPGFQVRSNARDRAGCGIGGGPDLGKGLAAWEALGVRHGAARGGFWSRDQTQFLS